MLNMSNMATTDNNSLSPSPTPADKAVQIRKEEINKIALENLRDPDIKLKDWQIAAFLRLDEKRLNVISVPTGSGKTMIYGLAPVLLGRAVLVICPLLSLLADQIENIHQRYKYKAEQMTTETNIEELAERIRANEIRIVFTTPESYMKFYKRLSAGGKLFNELFSAFVIDEAQDLVLMDVSFRRDFMQISKQQFPKLLLLSGSLTKFLDYLLRHSKHVVRSL